MDQTPGALHKHEAVAYGRKKGIITTDFPKADKNGDGSLTREEVKAFYAKTGA